MGLTNKKKGGRSQSTFYKSLEGGQFKCYRILEAFVQGRAVVT